LTHNPLKPLPTHLARKRYHFSATSEPEAEKSAVKPVNKKETKKRSQRSGTLLTKISGYLEAVDYFGVSITGLNLYP